MWCDFCGRTRTDNTLPEKTQIHDTGGELICEACNKTNIHEIGVYTTPTNNRLVIVYYRTEPVEQSLTINNTEIPLQETIQLQSPKNAKEAYETVQSVKGPAHITVDANHTDD